MSIEAQLSYFPMDLIMTELPRAGCSHNPRIDGPVLLDATIRSTRSRTAVDEYLHVSKYTRTVHTYTIYASIYACMSIFIHAHAHISYNYPLSLALPGEVSSIFCMNASGHTSFCFFIQSWVGKKHHPSCLWVSKKGYTVESVSSRMRSTR